MFKKTRDNEGSTRKLENAVELSHTTTSKEERLKRSVYVLDIAYTEAVEALSHFLTEKNGYVSDKLIDEFLDFRFKFDEVFELASKLGEK